MKPLQIGYLCVIAMLMAGCATPGQRNPHDPFEATNRAIFQFNETADKAITKPIAQGYNKIVPVVGRTMIGNFFSNLDDVVITVNDILQFKLSQAFSDTGRVLINSTIGVGGLIDVASITGLEKHNEDFGQTMGYWGIDTGPYLMLPFFGPADVRDGIGMYIDTLPSQLGRIRPIHTRNQLYATKAINRRAQLLDQEKMLDEAALDRYTFIRDAYLSRRQSLVYDGDPPHEQSDDDDFGEGTPTPTTPETPATPSAPAALNSLSAPNPNLVSSTDIHASKPVRVVVAR